MGQIHKGSLTRLGGGNHRRIPRCHPAGGSQVRPLIAWAQSVGFRLSAHASDWAGQAELARHLGLEQGLKVRER